MFFKKDFAEFSNIHHQKNWVHKSEQPKNWKNPAKSGALGKWKSPQSKEVCHYRRPFDVEFLYTLEFSIDILLFQGLLKFWERTKKALGNVESSHRPWDEGGTPPLI